MRNFWHSVVILAHLFAATLAIGGGRQVAAAPVPSGTDSQPAVEKRAAATLPDVLERVRLAASAEDWKKEGWTDPVIEEWLRYVLAAIQAAGHGKELPAPVTFADYARREPLVEPRIDRFARPRPGEGSLFVTDRLDVRHLRHTIALVDGDAKVQYADDCVIIARGAVSIGNGQGNIVIAGVFLNVGFDGRDRYTAGHLRRAEARGAALGRPPRPRREGAHPPAPASLLLSGDTLRVGRAGETVCGAARLVEVGHAWGCVLLNSPGKNLTHRNDSVDLELDSVKLGPPPEPHPLAGDVKLHSAADDTAIFWHKGRRIMGEVGKPITNEAGDAIPELDGWSVSIVDNDLAVFSSAKQRASVVLLKQESGGRAAPADGK